MSNDNSNSPKQQCKSVPPESIVKSILYACVVSCMAGPMSEMLKSPAVHLFQLTVGFLWFLFYSAYLYDEIRSEMKYDKDSPCIGLDIVGWMCFMAQGCVISYSGNISIIAGCIGLMVISWSLHTYQAHAAKGDQVCRCKWWIKENIVVFVFMGCILFSHLAYQKLRLLTCVKSCSWFQYVVAGFMLVAACFGFYYKFCKIKK